jgi:hypothetical protein
MKINFKEKLSRIDVRKIPKWAAGAAVVVASFGLVMFLRQFDVDKDENKEEKE